jgi:hypothetical protein
LPSDRSATMRFSCAFTSSTCFISNGIVASRSPDRRAELSKPDGCSAVSQCGRRRLTCQTQLHPM